MKFEKFHKLIHGKNPVWLLVPPKWAGSISIDICSKLVKNDMALEPTESDLENYEKFLHDTSEEPGD
jgi:hypothetical protein